MTALLTLAAASLVWMLAQVARMIRAGRPR